MKTLNDLSKEKVCENYSCLSKFPIMSVFAVIVLAVDIIVWRLLAPIFATVDGPVLLYPPIFLIVLLQIWVSGSIITFFAVNLWALKLDTSTQIKVFASIRETWLLQRALIHVPNNSQMMGNAKRLIAVKSNIKRLSSYVVVASDGKQAQICIRIPRNSEVKSLNRLQDLNQIAVDIAGDLKLHTSSYQYQAIDDKLGKIKIRTVIYNVEKLYI